MSILNKKKMRLWKKLVLILSALLGVIYIVVLLFNTYKGLPEGVSYEGDLRKTDTVNMYTDLTYSQNKKDDDFVNELSIMDEIYGMIDEAEEFIVLDFFLLDHYYDEDVDFPEIAQTLTEKLLKKKRDYPQMPITFITDPLNTGYGSYDSKWFSQMEDAGIEVVYTDLDPLRDSTPIYSGLYRMFFQWGDFGGKGWIANAMASKAPKMTLASYMTLLNVKANHRKTVITDKEALVTSSNPHNASGFHGNVALKVKGEVLNDILESEEAIVKYTKGGKLPRVESDNRNEGQYEVQYITEKKILDRMLEDIAKAKQGDTIHINMFFISEAKLVDAFVAAANRGVEVEMILDPNENSFGNEKSGLPNRPVVQKMVEETDGKIKVRWYNTVIGQYHTKLVVVKTSEETYISNGSANLTERTLRNYNLEANLRVIAPNDSELVEQLDDYFNRLWENEGALFTLDIEEYQDGFTFFQRGINALQRLFKLTTY